MFGGWPSAIFIIFGNEYDYYNEWFMQILSFLMAIFLFYADFLQQ